MPLELFFDLVFVLALTQCTALMADEPTWAGVAQGDADPRGPVVGLGRLRVAHERRRARGDACAADHLRRDGGDSSSLALAIPQGFGDWALLLACAYAVVRVAHIAPLHPRQRRRPPAALLGHQPRRELGDRRRPARRGGVRRRRPPGRVLWLVALLIDFGGPFLFGVEGWRLIPGHFAERYGLIVIIALGESIVAIGVGAEFGLDAGVVTAAVVGIAIAAALWWLYFDVVALVAERRLSRATPGREQNSLARDSYSYLHLPMIAGIVLLALGLKKALEHVGDPLHTVPAAALLGGVAALPARPRRLPLAHRPPLQQPAAGLRGSPARRAPPARRGGPRPRRRWPSSRRSWPP